MKQARRIRFFGLAALLLGLLSLFLRQLSFSRGSLTINHYLVPMMFMFMGMALCSGRSLSLSCYMGAAFVGWYAITRLLLGEMYLDDSFHEFALLCMIYLLALPFAAWTDDAGRRQGLVCAALIFSFVALVFALLGLAGTMKGTMIWLPRLETAYFGVDGEMRLMATNHANISAAMFLLAIMLNVWLMTRFSGKMARAALLLMCVIFYIAIALTVSRTVMLQTSFFAALTAAYLSLRLPVRAGWKRLAVFAVTALVAFVLVFSCFDLVVDLMSGASSLIPEASAEAQQPEQIVAERSLARDLATMTGRTDIYRNVLDMFIERPDLLLTGAPTAESLRVLRRYVGPFFHTHNAFLQTAFFAGLPALLIALYFAVRTAWASLRILVLRAKDSTFEEKLLCIILLTLLVSTIPETYLFTVIEPWQSYLFFLILGYVLEMEKRLTKA